MALGSSHGKIIAREIAEKEGQGRMKSKKLSDVLPSLSGF